MASGVRLRLRKPCNEPSARDDRDDKWRPQEEERGEVQRWGFTREETICKRWGGGGWLDSQGTAGDTRRIA